jgi:hypothetical protein
MAVIYSIYLIGNMVEGDCLLAGSKGLLGDLPRVIEGLELIGFLEGWDLTHTRRRRVVRRKVGWIHYVDLRTL